MTIVAIFEAEMTREQAERLGALMAEARPTRPGEVITAALLVEDGSGGDCVARLQAFWTSRAAFDAYMETVEVPRGTELMRKVGVEPDVRLVEVLELG